VGDGRNSALVLQISPEVLRLSRTIRPCWTRHI